MAEEKTGDYSHFVSEVPSEQSQPVTKRKVKWYRSTLYNAIILGICNFCAPGIWGAMNSLGGGGQQDPCELTLQKHSHVCIRVLH